MNERKEERVELLRQAVELLTKIKELYLHGTPGGVLVTSAFCNVTSLHHLEAKTHFECKELGAKFDDKNAMGKVG